MKSAYIVPHPPIAWHSIGRGEEKKIQKTLDSYDKIAEMIADEKPETIVIISPHNVLFKDAFYINPGPGETDDLSQFGDSAASVTYEYDAELRDELIRSLKDEGIPVVSDSRYSGRHDHGSVIPLLFIGRKYTGYRVLRMAPSFLSYETLMKAGGQIERAATRIGRKITVIASGDLSHKLSPTGPYGFAPEGPEFDKKITKAMETADFSEFLGFDGAFIENAAECGLMGFIMLSGALSGYDVTPRFLSYEGPFGVGYAVCAFTCEDVCVRLAKESIAAFLKTGRLMKRPDKLPKSLTDKRAGVFVSIHKNGELRGCIGTIRASTGSTAEEIISLAAEAAFRDPRFPPVGKDELPELEISVDILSDPVPARFEELSAKRYGVIVTLGGRRGLLLPDLEGVDTPLQQVQIALMKAGISQDENYSLERFTVERHT